MIQNLPGGFKFFLFLFFPFDFQAFFEFPSGILNETLNPSSGVNSSYIVPFELRSKNAALF